VAEELGTWPAEQATVLLEVLQQAGLNPTATRTREGILVTDGANHLGNLYRIRAGSTVTGLLAKYVASRSDPSAH
jgi:lipase chaperone LimK